MHSTTGGRAYGESLVGVRRPDAWLPPRTILPHPLCKASTARTTTGLRKVRNSNVVRWTRLNLSKADKTRDSLSTSYSQVVLIYLYPFRHNLLLKSTLQPQIAKNTKTRILKIQGHSTGQQQIGNSEAQVRLRTRTLPGNDLRQVVHTRVPLSLSSVTVSYTHLTLPTKRIV